ncbi:hypothetical protein [Roseovarius sp.]|jgi:hypothetical protein|uniref:hypothetical protein n=1 Tax=Roseovarius sp. TaxID=1486281 RepID=UPI002639FD76|nr:hypothetical protein [Roseovarius sp.]MDM8167331.1 hypothetical protein [Roseovarius sp.]
MNIIRKRLLAGVTASAVGVAGLAGLSAAPAYADNDTAKYIAGAAAVAIIGAAIADSNDDRYYNPGYATRDRYYGGYNRYNRHQGYARNNRTGYQRAYNQGYRDGYANSHSSYGSSSYRVYDR